MCYIATDGGSRPLVSSANLLPRIVAVLFQSFHSLEDGDVHLTHEVARLAIHS